MTSNKIHTLDLLLPIVDKRRRTGERCVFTNGAFGFIHPGHIWCLEAARREADFLIVAVNSDESYTRLKQRRPLFPWDHRAQLIAALECVSFVTALCEDTPHCLLEAIRPDVLVKGPTSGSVIGREIVEAYGGRVVVTGEFGGYSATGLIKKLSIGS